MTIPNGYFTIKSPTGEHRTFRIRTQKDDAEFAPGKRILGLMTTTDNVEGYRGFAFVNGDGIKVWKSKLSGDPTKPSFHEKCAKMLWSLVEDGDRSNYAKMGCTIHREEHCMICNRILTTPESIERGIGPECAKRVEAHVK